MRIFLTGVGCVGKSTIGKRLAEIMDLGFFDLDLETEGFFGESIERLQNRFLTIYSFRLEASKALIHLLRRPESLKSVIALPPSGLMAGYLNPIKKANRLVVAITDRPENILERITFFDIESKPIRKVLTPEEKRWHLKDIKKDITHFGRSYKRARINVDIDGLDVEGAAYKLKEAIEAVTQMTCT